MRRALACAAPLAAALAFPAAAFAKGQGESLTQPPVSLIVSLIGLIVAVVLLVEALSVRQLGAGGAITAKINYVILAIICLAASAIAQWARNFVYGVTLDQVQFASQVLVIAAMGLLAAYFTSVRRAFQSYMTSMTGGQALRDEVAERPAAEQPPAEEDPERA